MGRQERDLLKDIRRWEYFRHEHQLQNSDDPGGRDRRGRKNSWAPRVP